MVGGTKLLRPTTQRSNLHHQGRRARTHPRRLRRRRQRLAAAFGHQQCRRDLSLRKRRRRSRGRHADGRDAAAARIEIDRESDAGRRRRRSRSAGQNPPTRAQLRADLWTRRLARRLRGHRRVRPGCDQGQGGIFVRSALAAAARDGLDRRRFRARSPAPTMQLRQPPIRIACRQYWWRRRSR